MSGAFGAGRFIPWTGGCILIGQSTAVIPEHSHYAIQLAFGSEPGIRFQSDGRWTAYDGAIIPSRQPHGMDATVVPLSAVLLIESETAQGRALTSRYLEHGIAEAPAQVLDAIRPVLFDAARRKDDAAVIDACRALVGELTDGIAPREVTDERILRAVAFINGNLHQSLTLDAVAGEACLSPSRFRHLFVEETGMAMRPYILWRRFLYVWDLLARGNSLSTAAHAAGFADAAHLSRTSRQMFGFPPSALHIENPAPSFNRQT